MSIPLAFAHETVSADTLLFVVFRKQLSAPQCFWIFLRGAITGSLTIYHISEVGESHGAWCQQESVDQIALVDFDFVCSQQVLIHWSLTQACGTFLYIYVPQHWYYYSFLQYSIIKVVEWCRSGNSYGISQCKLMIFPCWSWSAWLLLSLLFVNNFHCLSFSLFMQRRLSCFVAGQ